MTRNSLTMTCFLKYSWKTDYEPPSFWWLCLGWILLLYSFYFISPVYANNILKRKTKTWGSYSKEFIKGKWSKNPKLPPESNPGPLNKSRDARQYATEKPKYIRFVKFVFICWIFCWFYSLEIYTQYNTTTMIRLILFDRC